MKANRPLNTFILLVLIALPLGSSRLRAQDQPAAAAGAVAEEIDLEARKQSIVNLEQHIAEREARKAEIVEDIMRMDSRIEDRVSKIVDKLKTLKDSKDSRLRVAQTKETVIAGLRAAIQQYDSTRRRVKEEMAKANPAVPKETLSSDVKVFNEKIEKRVDQIMDITNSLATHKDYAKYVRTGSNRRWGGSSTRKNSDYFHNRQQTSRSNQDRKAIGEAIQASIEKIKRANRDIETKLKAKGLSSEQRSLLTEERDVNDELIARREGQLEQLLAPVATPTRAIGRDEAHNIDMLLKDMAGDLDADFDTMFRYYTDLNQERVQIKKLTDNLAARKAWMKKYESEKAK